MFLKNDAILISTQLVIQILKKKNLLPEWFNENTPLPPDPDGRLIFVHKQPVHNVCSSRKICLENYRNDSDEIPDSQMLLKDCVG